MKKFMMILVCLLVSINVVSAQEYKTYYSEYGIWSDYSLDVYTKDDLKDVEVERRYKWFKNEERGEYLRYDIGINNYDRLDKNNYKYTDFSVWQTKSIESVKDRVIETKKQYGYKKIKPINTIYIYNNLFKTEEVNLNQIEIYNNGKKVNFSATCGGCSANYTLANISGLLILELDNYYYFDDMEIKIKPINIKDIELLRFMVAAPSLDNNTYLDVYYEAEYKPSNSDTEIYLTVRNFSKGNPRYEEEVIYDSAPYASISDVVREFNLYRFKDKLYYFYTYDRKYVDGYFKIKDGYEKDEENYVDYYRYRNRDKLMINDYIEISEKNKKIDDYIQSTTDYNIDGVIDYTKNGLYDIKVKTYFITKDVKVLININSNNLEDSNKNDGDSKLEDNKNNQNNNSNFDSETKKGNEILDDYQNLENRYDDKLVEKSNTIKKRSSLDNRNNKEESNCQEKLEEVTLKSDDNEKKLKLSNQAYDYLNSSLLKINNNGFSVGLSWYLWLLLLIIILIIIIIIILKRKKNKNKF